MVGHGRWIGVDLDGTLALYDGWKGADHIGDPIPGMVDRVKKWLAAGKDVRIFTARAYCPELPNRGDPDYAVIMAQRGDHVAAMRAIREWCLKHIGQVLPVTNAKDYGMDELWDDRAIPVKFNEGYVRTLHAMHGT